MWGRFWANFADQPPLAYKVKAHSGHEALTIGDISKRDFEGNRLADYFAKKGAHEHPMDLSVPKAMLGLSQVVREVALFAGRQEALFHDPTLADSTPLDQLQPRGSARLPANRRPRRLLRPAFQLLAQPSPLHATAVLGHSLRQVQVDREGPLLFCAICGHYAWRQLKGLSQSCPGPPTRASGGLWEHRRRLAKGKFPSPGSRWAKARLGEPSWPSPAIVAWLLEATELRHRHPAPSPSSSSSAASPSFAEALSQAGFGMAGLAALAPLLAPRMGS
jgi:hypothetical protein